MRILHLTFKSVLLSMLATAVSLVVLSQVANADPIITVTPYENLSTTEPTTVNVSGSGLEPNTELSIRQEAQANVSTEEFTGVLVERLHKAVVTTDSDGMFSVNVSVQYDVRTDQNYFDFCQNQPVSISLCFLHLQYQSDTNNDVIAQTKLYFGVFAPTTTDPGGENPGNGDEEEPDESAAPLTKDDCKKDGWQNYTHLGFTNQGNCVSFVASNNKSLGL